MNSVITQMLSHYEIHSTQDEVNALKEIIQEIILSGLSRSDFFNRAAFYGGSALRIFYQLNRFSEDLDFSLLSSDSSFDLSSYFSYIEKELGAYGIDMQIMTKNKSVDSHITSAFLKGDTLEHILKFFPKTNGHSYDHILKTIKIKFEVDIYPPSGARYDVLYKLLPSPHQVRVYDQESLLAGKIHAILCRNWKTRIKGRDLYDYVFFLSQRISVNLNLIQNKLIESGALKKDDLFDLTILKEMLNQRFKKINYEEAKEDVIPFIKDVSTLNIWNEDFFISITEQLEESI